LSNWEIEDRLGNSRRNPAGFQISQLLKYQITKSSMNGVLIIDKPSGLTSHDVVNRVRRILGQRSVGHLGTLDPMATGVLPLVLGSYTRLAQFYTTSEKTYEGSIRFGFATDTYDAEGEPTTTTRPVDLKLESLQQLSTEFLGQIEQTPPPFSAKKIQGVPAYKLARKSHPVDLKPVQVEIKEFTITTCEKDRATFQARVASGTYMRSVAHDMGQRLGCGAHLATLRRTSAAEFDLTQAHTLVELQSRCADSNPTRSDRDSSPCHSEHAQSAGEEPNVTPTPPQQPKLTKNHAASQAVQQLLIHPRQLLPQLPSVTADEITTAHIRNGRPINLPDLSRARQVKVFANQRDLVAIATRIAGTLFHPKIVFPAESPEPPPASVAENASGRQIKKFAEK
jgi:tRNA pseudouridine55 synthase